MVRVANRELLIPVHQRLDDAEVDVLVDGRVFGHAVHEGEGGADGAERSHGLVDLFEGTHSRREDHGLPQASDLHERRDVG